MKAFNILLAMILAIMFFVVFGAFFDVITSKEAVLVLAVLGLPLTVANKILA